MFLKVTPTKREVYFAVRQGACKLADTFFASYSLMYIFIILKGILCKFFRILIGDIRLCLIYSGIYLQCSFIIIIIIIIC
jgi:hypothetical protein